ECEFTGRSQFTLIVANARRVDMGRRSNVPFLYRERCRSIEKDKRRKCALSLLTARTLIRQAILSGRACLPLELHGEATASRVDSNTPLCRGNADYHTGLI